MTGFHAIEIRPDLDTAWTLATDTHKRIILQLQSDVLTHDILRTISDLLGPADGWFEDEPSSNPKLTFPGTLPEQRRLSPETTNLN